MLRKPRQDVTGMRFGSLTAIAFAGITARRHSHWSFRCDCGTLVAARLDCVKKGNTTSCGCAQKRAAKAANTTHGHNRRHSPEYTSWSAMLQRCTNEKLRAYRYYGGRGIQVCDRWRKFADFLADMGPRPKGTSLDRIDVDGHYEPSNCRWATKVQQANNTRSNVPVVLAGVHYPSVAAASAATGVHSGTARNRMLRGLSNEQSFQA